VGALKLFARTRRARVIEDVRVLRGVRLPRFSDPAASGGGHELLVRVEADGRAALFQDGATQPSYTARLIGAARAAAPVPRGVLDPYAFSKDAIYADLLFHGPAFQLVDDVIGASAEGLVAQVRGVRAANEAAWKRFGGEPYVLDVAALDAALQATLLWARHVTGGAYLPTSLGRLVVGAGIASGAYRCVVAARAAPELVAEADVALINERGEVAYRLESVRVHRLPDDAAFSRPPSFTEARA
jgi:Polyketide synthase dehydratase